MLRKPHEINHFLLAQSGRLENGVHCVPFSQALAELRAGQKRSHWIWYVFPQRAGLGCSQMNQAYSIYNIEQAQRYLENPELRAHLIEAIQAVLASGDTPAIVFGPDREKYWASITLFYAASEHVDSELRELTTRALEWGFESKLHQGTQDWLPKRPAVPPPMPEPKLPSPKILNTSIEKTRRIEAQIASIKRYTFIERVFQFFYRLFFGKSALRKINNDIDAGVLRSLKGEGYSTPVRCHRIWLKLMGYRRVNTQLLNLFEKESALVSSHPAAAKTFTVDSTKRTLKVERTPDARASENAIGKSRLSKRI